MADFDCLAEKLWLLVEEIGLSKEGLTDDQRRQKLVLIAAISDLRAAYCSFCNKLLVRTATNTIDAKVFGQDRFKNKMWMCNICADLNSGLNIG